MENILQKIILKIYFPLLRFYNFDKTSGIYKQDGSDTFLLTKIFNSLDNNNSNTVIEINNKLNSELSILGLFLKKFGCKALIFSTHQKTYVTNIIHSGTKNDYSDLIKYGIDDLDKNEYSEYSYSNDLELSSIISTVANEYLLLTMYYNKDLIQLLDNVLENNKIKYLYIQNNTKDFYLKIGDNKLRKLLLSKGYIYLSRINAKDDFFLLSEYVNGFPSEEFKFMNTKSLQRWISEPPDFDYTKPL